MQFYLHICFSFIKLLFKTRTIGLVAFRVVFKSDEIDRENDGFLRLSQPEGTFNISKPIPALCNNSYYYDESYPLLHDL